MGPLPADYAERVYAGVLGKIVGVYLGRPFEQWSRETIAEKFGEIEYYVNEAAGVPLVVADDDISGTFTFLRTLEDNDFAPNLTPEQIGETWLNYIVENRTVLWWGGMSTSTEHTAYLRLKSGVKAPLSGAIETNGKTVAEQIGAQIFIDGWGLIHPGDPASAADWARRAASVSHDGEAIHGAQVIAALIAAAFVEHDVEKMLDMAVAQIPVDCLIRRVIDYVRDLVRREPDWRVGFGELDDQFGYHRFGGACHIVPNHALVIFALLHGRGDFQESMRVVCSCGWDTDCNAGNLGCILGVRGGLYAFEEGPDWRGPVADQILIPTADGGRFATDAVREADAIVHAARRLRGFEAGARKARFHFNRLGSVQGFRIEDSQRSRQAGALNNTQGRLGITYQLAPGLTLVCTTPTFVQPQDLKAGGYGLLASPTLYPGQTVRARILVEDFGMPELAPKGPLDLSVYLLVKRYGVEDQVIEATGPACSFGSKRAIDLEWVIPGPAGEPICEVGFAIVSPRRTAGHLAVEFVGWDGAPTCEFVKPDHPGEMWLRQWVNGLSELRDWDGMDCVQNEDTGLAMVGCREWQNYAASAKMRVLASESAGLAVNVQGLRRYYALTLERGRATLVKARDGLSLLAERPFEWSIDETYDLRLETKRRSDGVFLRAYIDGEPIFQLFDSEQALVSGAMGVVVSEGRAQVESVRIEPLP